MKALQRYAEKEPETRAALRELHEGLLTQAAVKALLRCRRGKRGVFLSLLFEAGDEDRARVQLSRWLRFNHGQDLLDQDVNRMSLPKAVESVLGISHRDVLGGVSQALLAPLWSHLAGEHALSPDARAELRRWLPQFTLDRNRIDQMLEDGFGPGLTRRYFLEPPAALRHRNSIVYLQATLASDRDGGRIQSRIPRRLSAHYGLRPLSIPDTEMFLDVLALVRTGVIDAPDHDPHGVVDTLAGLNQAASVLGEPPDDLLPLRVVDGHVAERLADRQSRVSRLDSSLYFNLDRQLSRDFASFRSYYDRFDGSRFLQLASKVWAPDVWHAVLAARLAAPEAFQGVQARDRANIIALLTLRPEEPPERVLPPVALFGLGMSEPVATGRGRGSRPGRRSRGRGRLRLPILEQMQRSTNLSLSQPDAGAPGDLVVVPRAILRAYRNIPPNVVGVGPETVPWGEDIYAYTQRWMQERPGEDLE